MNKLYDIYSFPFYSYYKNKTKFSTNISKSLSLILFIICIILIIFLFKDNKQNLIFYNLLENNKITFLNHHIILGIINTTNNNIIPINENKYNISVYDIYSDYNNEKKEEINLINCNENDNLKNDLFFKNLNISNLKCFLNYQTIYKIYNFHDIQKYIKITIINNTELKNIKNEKFILIYFNFLINYNEKNPIKNYIYKIKTFSFFENYNMNYYISFNSAIYSSKKFFNKKKYFYFYEYNNFNFEYYKSNENQKIININLISNEYTKYYKLIHKSFIEIISDLGGFIYILNSLFYNFSLFINKKLFYNEIILTLINNNCKNLCEQAINEKKIKINKLNETNHINYNTSNFNLLTNIKKVENKFNSSKIMGKININKNIKKNKTDKNYFVIHNFNKNTSINKKINKLKIFKEITNETIKNYLNNFNYKIYKDQKLKYSFFEYFIPFIFLKQNKKFSLFNLFIEIYSSTISINNIIPMLETLKKLFNESDTINFSLNEISYFRIFSINELNNNIYKKENSNNNEKKLLLNLIKE